MPELRMTKDGETITVNVNQSAVAEYRRLGWTLINDDQTLVILRRTVILVDEEIKALPGAPIEIVPAPGAGKALIALFVFGVCDATNGAYSNIDAEAIGPVLAYGSDLSATTSVANGDNDWLLAEDSAVNYFQMAMRVKDSGELTQFIDQPLVLSFDNASSEDLTGGDPANTLAVNVFYAVVDL